MTFFAFPPLEDEKIDYQELLCIAEKKIHDLESDRFSIFPIFFHLKLYFIKILFF